MTAAVVLLLAVLVYALSAGVHLLGALTALVLLGLLLRSLRREVLTDTRQ